MQTTTYQSLKFKDSKNSILDDTVVIEAPLQININNQPYTVVMRTPGNDLELIRGLLFAEDIYKSSQNIEVHITEEDNYSSIINCTITKDKIGKGYLNKRTLLSVSSCGICGKKELSDIKVSGEKLANHSQISRQEISDMYAKMYQYQETFRASGGSHAAAVFDTSKELLTIKEDIGRHNAVDKCVGDLLENNQLKKGKSLFVSGRVSYEIVSKAFIAKIPIIVAVSACSSLSIDFAKEFGICLIGFSRETKMTVYSNPQYVNYE
ncbi:FdhD protein [Lutibacter sp. Hel_I_33_5]|uniref:formate dehydrogenase accessory sulfurtransferase FdhD n=1 Tax=Lutibacter sp. Hel_I_33_5 TaxID=1566289 RepID=UPI0011A7BCD5|nr:formate dehydrogenase accessory sulfurtransferase FdhD [Lutibacter sp. Hel_I_33_5]TVZ55577.1 FdhD protein [Lutibacter sp. Hel_I_33_5]